MGGDKLFAILGIVVIIVYFFNKYRNDKRR